MRVLVAMSGGVDSSVAAALLAGDGHEVVGVTMKLWGGPSDTGCCSVSDTEDARRVAQQLGITHHVFNFSEDFDRHVVEPYVAAHAAAITPNPCVECNRHLKFDRLLDRADKLGFDAVATGHHARVSCERGEWRLLRGADQHKDQSYVLHMLGQRQLSRTRFPIGELTKADVRSHAVALGLRTAAKPDSQDVCFISRVGGRAAFLEERIGLHPALVVDEAGSSVGTLRAIELVAVGQRRGLGQLGQPGDRRYVTSVDPDSATVTVGPPSSLMVTEVPVTGPTWVSGPPDPDEDLEVQTSAHGTPVAARWAATRAGTGTWSGTGTCAGTGRVVVAEPVRRVAPGQSVVLYRGEAVVGGGTAA